MDSYHTLRPNVLYIFILHVTPLLSALFLHSDNIPRNPGFGPGVGVHAGPVTAGIASILPE